MPAGAAWTERSASIAANPIAKDTLIPLITHISLTEDSYALAPGEHWGVGELRYAVE